MILVFASEHNQMAEFLDQWSSNGSFYQTIERCFFLSEFESKLKHPHPDINAAIVCIDDAQEIIDATNMREQLLDLKLVIVLPFRDNNLISWAYKLGPRFIAYADDEIQILVSVLRKVLNPF